MKPTDVPLSQLERNFINRYQSDFPLQKKPFALIARHLDCSEKKLIKTIKNLKEKKVLTRFGPLYNADRLGGGLTLAAMSVPEDRFEVVTQLVNSYAEVAHNYRREHKLNMWFVLATESPVEIDRVLITIEQVTGLTVYNFPKQHEFYIGLRFDISKNNIHETVSFYSSSSSNNSNDDKCRLTELDRKIIKQTQSGLPLISQPYHEVASKVDCRANDVIECIKNMLNTGVIRRIGAVPNHYSLGFKANGMSVWDVPDELIIELGNQVGQLGFVSHSYQRPRCLPVWSYNLYAMVHGRTREAVSEKAKQIKQILGENCRAHEILYSTAILKKTGLRLAA